LKTKLLILLISTTSLAASCGEKAPLIKPGSLTNELIKLRSQRIKDRPIIPPPGQLMQVWELAIYRDNNRVKTPVIDILRFQLLANDRLVIRFKETTYEGTWQQNPTTGELVLKIENNRGKGFDFLDDEWYIEAISDTEMTVNDGDIEPDAFKGKAELPYLAGETMVLRRVPTLE
jgi:hypothetical protein